MSDRDTLNAQAHAALAEHGSPSKAAAALGIPRQTLSARAAKHQAELDAEGAERTFRAIDAANPECAPVVPASEPKLPADTDDEPEAAEPQHETPEPASKSSAFPEGVCSPVEFRHLLVRGPGPQDPDHPGGLLLAQGQEAPVPSRQVPRPPRRRRQGRQDLVRRAHRPLTPTPQETPSTGRTTDMSATITARVEKRNPCGFCSTGHHGLCPKVIRNGSASKVPVWVCPCSEAEHALGAPHREATVVRPSRSALGLPDPVLAPVQVETPAPAVTTTPAPAKAKAKAGKKGDDRFPEGTLPPVAFRHMMVEAQLGPGVAEAADGLQLVEQVKRGGTFPVRYYTADGAEHDTQVDGSRPGVLVEQGKQWYADQAAKG